METKNRPKVDSLNGSKPSTTASSTVVAVAINTSKKSKYTIKWAMQNLIPHEGPEHVCFKLLHVFPEITTVPTPMGNGIPISQVRDDVAAAYRKELELQTTEKLIPYKMFCIKREVRAEIVKIESDDVVNAIAHEIAKCKIDKLVIGASSTGVYVVSKGKLSSVRPSIPEVVSSPSDVITDTGGFSNYSSRDTINSQTEWTVQGSTISYPPSPTKQFQYVLATNDSRRTNSSDTKSVPYQIGDEEDDENSSCSSTDITNQTSKASSGSHSRTTNRSSSLYASTDFSSGSQVNINLELEQLKMELRNVQGMYAKAQTEAIDASRKLNDLQHQRLEDTVKLREISLKEDEAKALAEREKSRYEDAKTEAYNVMECMEREAVRKKAAEKRATRDAKAKEKLESSLIGPANHYQEFAWEEIESATLSFSDDLRVGMGSYGTVYKCNLRHTTAAVKILHSLAANRTKQFQQELEILSKIRHPNLLTLLGACPDRGCLVYEYMENGSLDERLFRRNNTPPIPWLDRYRIAHEVASALIFLHNSNPKPIIHRDLKPANILLNRNLVTKIGDVGLSTMLIHSDASNETTMYKDTSPVGTLCYIDPEYQRTGLVSPKSDVYAYGMVVLQLLTAKPAIALARKMEIAVDGDRLDRILDSEAGDWPADETKELAVLALRCTELRHRDRPDLKSEILPALDKLITQVAMSGRKSPPEHFMCPIRKVEKILVVMKDPCVAGDGYSYDREAIEEWFEDNDESPVTKLPLLNKSLIPNYTLLSAIMEWRAGKYFDHA
ncbi:U-box domain-containing protein 35 [Phtheirospermum japonicum]|uniref:RING-type E3 ubiquitin transferase n=1 Tax=Phtheirospermum japonicum TaxID=374723 RepID=A0A830CK39_9LAMI|nr:U-box domain-containing protein 35 [Phtheirospermum japonicum]